VSVAGRPQAFARGEVPTLFEHAWLDLVPYGSALRLQKRLQRRRIQGEIPDTLLLLEHPPTVTTGARSEGTTDVSFGEATLERKGIEVHRVRRGGHLTYHGPGQLVAYPIFELSPPDVEVFLDRLQSVVLRTLEDFGLEGTSCASRPEVRVEGRTIAALGIQLRRWVNRHGFALNVDLDLRPFHATARRAKPERRATTLERERDRAPRMKAVRGSVVEAFEAAFGRQARPIDESLVWERALDDVPDHERRNGLPRRGESDRVGRKPEWLKARMPGGDNFRAIRSVMEEATLNTVCEEASCPNLGECWGRGTATFMILGDTCTRACGFCDVKTGTDLDVDAMEPLRVARAVQKMELDHAVVTSVNRDDLPDGGASIWAKTLRCIRRFNPGTSVEVLIPDLMGDWDALEVILGADPDILNHNVETVPRLYPTVRPKARYDRSLRLLERAAGRGFPTKSGLMLGLGERRDEVARALEDLRERGVRILTLGQYLRPSDRHLPVDRWVHPEEFDRWANRAEALGFEHVESGPLVRSSYHAEEQVPAPSGAPAG